MPRIRDFRGVSPRAFDGQGNYTLGVKEQIIFPEIQYDQVDQVRGMDITITTTARDDRHGRALLEHSASRFGSNRNHKLYGEDEHGRAREASRRDREKVRGEAREAQGADPQPKSSPEQRVAAQVQLQTQPRDASASRQRNRCAITGRSRGVYRKFGLSRVKIREVASRGEIPGLAKASW